MVMFDPRHATCLPCSSREMAATVASLEATYCTVQMQMKRLMDRNDALVAERDGLKAKASAAAIRSGGMPCMHEPSFSLATQVIVARLPPCLCRLVFAPVCGCRCKITRCGQPTPPPLLRRARHR